MSHIKTKKKRGVYRRMKKMYTPTFPMPSNEDIIYEDDRYVYYEDKVWSIDRYVYMKIYKSRKGFYCSVRYNGKQTKYFLIYQNSSNLYIS